MAFPDPFEFRDGLISREDVWLDGNAIVAQLTAPDLAGATSSPASGPELVAVRGERVDHPQAVDALLAVEAGEEPGVVV